MIFFFNRSFLDRVQSKIKNRFFNFRFPLVSVNNLKWRANFLIYRVLIRDSNWLNFIHFSGYKYKIRLVTIIRKREDQALISISTILKFSAQNNFFCNNIKYTSACLYVVLIFNMFPVPNKL